MKSSRIVIFLFSVMLGLGILCVVFPKDGLQIGSIRLEFPDLAYALDAKTEVVADTLSEELEQEDSMETAEAVEQFKGLTDAQEAEFMINSSKSPTRIYLPNDSIEYLDDFFAALDEAKDQRVRIMHFGDSQLEGDRMTCYLRQAFQEAYGGIGLGLVPAVQTVSSVTLTEDLQGDAMRYLAYGPKSEQAEHHRYGPLCQMAEIDGEALLEFTCMGGKKFSHGGHFTQVTVLASGTGSLELFVGNDSIGDIREIESETMQMLNFPAGGYKGRLAITGHVEIYGLMLDGGRGVQMDNIGLRGSSGTLFTSIDRSTLTPFFSRENVRLIILQYGGNAVPYMDEQSDINGYVSGMRSQIRMFKRLAPQSCILFIGPSDMATQVGEEMVTYPILPNLISSLRKMCGEEGVAFWNMFAAQGGAGSMIRWCELGLAGEDYVHFSPSGARRISKLFFESLQKYYQFYRLRMGLDNMEEPSDSTENATGKDSVRKADEKIRSARRDSIKATMAKRDTTKTGKEMLP